MNELLSSSGSGMISLKREQAFSLLDGLNALKDSNNASNYNNTYLTLQCATNPLLGPDNQYPKDGDPKNGFLWFMNGCHFDPTSTYIPSNTKQALYRLSQYVLQWFDMFRFVNPFLFALCFLLPFLLSVYDEDHYTEELGSNFAYYVLQTLALFFRLAIVQSFNMVLLLAIRQPCPCSCRFVGYGNLHQGGDIDSQSVNGFFSVMQEPFSPSNVTAGTTFILGNSLGWCMPNEEVLMGIVLIMHVLERYSVFVGLPALIILPCTAILAGESSVGQMLTSLAIGIIYHFYSTRTPLVLRSIDFVITLFGGIIALFVTKHFYPEVDFAYTTLFWEGLIYQIFSVLMLFLCFSMAFLKRMMLRWSLYRLSPKDIQYMNMKLLPDNQSFSTFDKQLEEMQQGDGIRSSVNDRIKRRRSRRVGVSEEENLSLIQDYNGNVFSRLYHKKYLMILVLFITFISLCALHVLSEWMNEALSFGRDKF
ncbi:hypothetical protein FDP41_007302 [Naegleria fowleri]|uniref:Uncharacterized protein n=1 Tax=Naegleria fowleri TaxID=5763 RepID=A0A6A5BJS6_NAEFO|nr:uncharacterized protein FDP41_007302 [Naegleria fowleri]KAF0973915.1 hypothetical protein FDP41_007302 [Naegleria fowleri]CAG4712163.1 unnamed protein product [Naegleria fowleri]